MENKNNENQNVHTYNNRFHPREVTLKENYKFYRHGFFFRLINKLTIFFTKFFLFIPRHFVWGFKIIGKKNLKKQNGFVLISNHSHPFDPLLILSSFPTKKIYALTLQSNMGFGLVSKYFRMGGAVPIPVDPNMMLRFSIQTLQTLKAGYNLLVFPEESLDPYCNHIRNFKPGAFHIALQTNTKIIPTVITFHRPRGLFKITRRKKPCLHYNILEPYEIKDLGNQRETLANVTKEVNEIMSNYFNEHSDYFF